MIDKKKCFSVFSALLLGGLLSGKNAYAFSSADAVTEVVNAAVSISKESTLEDASLSDAAFKTGEMKIVKEISEYIARSVIRFHPDLVAGAVGSQDALIQEVAEGIQDSYVETVSKASSSGSLGSSFAGKLAADVIVGIVIDVAVKNVKEIIGPNHPFLAEYAAFFVKQTRVAWAARNGIHAAILESAVLTGEQLYEMVRLANKLEGILDDNAVKDAVNDAKETVYSLRAQYVIAPPSEKDRILSDIRETLSNNLVYYAGLFSGQKPVPYAEQVIDRFVSATVSRDDSKYSVADALFERIRNAHPDQMEAYEELGLDLIMRNFYDPALWGGSSEDLVNPARDQRRRLYASINAVNDRAKADALRLRLLILEAMQSGGPLVSSVSEQKQATMFALAKAIDSEFEQEQVSNVIFMFPEYAEKYAIDPIDFTADPESISFNFSSGMPEDFDAYYKSFSVDEGETLTLCINNIEPFYKDENAMEGNEWGESVRLHTVLLGTDDHSYPQMDGSPVEGSEAEGCFEFTFPTAGNYQLTYFSARRPGSQPDSFRKSITFSDYPVNVVGKPQDSMGEQSGTRPTPANVPQPLNDTGIAFCGRGSRGKTQPCTGNEPAGQDAHYGRDAAMAAGELEKTGGGSAGFDYTKIANNGSELPANATLGSGPNEWACTRDNVTGHLWEVKVDDDSHLRHFNHRYVWFNPLSPDGYPGDRGSTSSCSNTLGGEKCNSENYVAAVNAAGLCGYSDWRIPSVHTLQGIVNYNRRYPAIDILFFPNTWAGYGERYWSSSLNAGLSRNVLGVDFEYGTTFETRRSYRSENFLRVVRDGQ